MKKLFTLFAIALTLSASAQWNPQLAGFSSNTPIIKFAKAYPVSDSLEHVEFAMAASTSNATIFYLTLPYASANSSIHSCGNATDNSSGQATPLRIDLTKGSNIAKLYKTPSAVAWTASGGKGSYFEFTYAKQLGTRQNLVFLGNSLLNYNSGTLVPNGYYVPISVASDLGVSYSNISSQLLAINGQMTAYMNRDFNSYVDPLVDSNTVVIQWGITVDVANGLTPDSVWKDTKAIADKVHAKGAKIIVCTFICRNATGDAASVYTNGNIVNDSIRANTSYFDGVVDLAANVIYDQKTDANNTTYFNADKVHTITPAQDTTRYMIVRALKATGYFH